MHHDCVGGDTGVAVDVGVRHAWMHTVARDAIVHWAASLAQRMSEHNIGQLALVVKLVQTLVTFQVRFADVVQIDLVKSVKKEQIMIENCFSRMSVVLFLQERNKDTDLFSSLQQI